MFLVLRDWCVGMCLAVGGGPGFADDQRMRGPKAAVRSMTRSFGQELRSRAVRVNAVSPGPIDTRILERSMPGDAASAARAQMTADNPMGPFGDPERSPKLSPSSVSAPHTPLAPNYLWTAELPNFEVNGPSKRCFRLPVIRGEPAARSHCGRRVGSRRPFEAGPVKVIAGC